MGELTDIKTGDKDVQDASDEGLYPFYIRSAEVLRSDTYSFDGEAILIPGEGRLGEIFHYINGKFAYHQRVYKISDFTNSYAQFVLQYMMKSFKKHAMQYTVKATVDSLRKPTIQDFIVPIPSILEQQSIGTFFSTLDHLITLQQRERHFHNSDAKSSFSGNISHHIGVFTAIIFHSYTNTWEQRKLGTIANFSKGKGYTKKDLANSGTKIILYGRMYTDFQFSIETTDTFVVAQDDSVYSEGNEVLIPSSGETPTDIARASAITKSGIIIGGDLNIVQPNKDIIPSLSL
ncbi:restriction endonuclease subunit S [Streptococcus sp. 121]|nr:restriction endonuclease subunit S [Streptococcus sp. 121]